jgi:hypothetical protein
MGLSPAAVEAAVAELRAYDSTVPRRLLHVSHELVEEGVEVARSEAPSDLRPQIHVGSDGPRAFTVEADGELAAFVEFGVGVVGRGTYPGHVTPPYHYDDGYTPSAHDPLDPSAWYYRDASGRVRRTKGNMARPFMLPAAERMRSRARDVAKEVWDQ